jgi:hypothetical protein
MGSAGLLFWALLGVILVSVAENVQVRDMKIARNFEVMFVIINVDKNLY